MIEIEQEYSLPFDFQVEELIETVVLKAAELAGCPYEPEVNVMLTDNEGIRVINNEQRNIDSPTDVLSFPMLDYEFPCDFSHLEEDDSLFDLDTGALILGDIILSLDRVKSQAESYGHSEKREMAFLIAHSMMHLFGYDHMTEEEAAVMERRQEEVLEALDIRR